MIALAAFVIGGTITVVSVATLIGFGYAVTRGYRASVEWMFSKSPARFYVVMGVLLFLIGGFSLMVAGASK